jgi:23S rRNA A1618 N6-methylase RlmF
MFCAKFLVLICSGTGASCVYPLLGCKKNGWCFLASELDETNFNMAEKNIQKNNMQEKIKGKDMYLYLLTKNISVEYCIFSQSVH